MNKESYIHTSVDKRKINTAHEEKIEQMITIRIWLFTCSVYASLIIEINTENFHL